MDPLASLAGKLLGALGGAFVALVFNPPSNRRKFAWRYSGSVIFGMLFAPVTYVYLPAFLTWLLPGSPAVEWPGGIEGIIAAAAAAAIAAWPLMVLVTARLGDKDGGRPP